MHLQPSILFLFIKASRIFRFFILNKDKTNELYFPICFLATLRRPIMQVRVSFLSRLVELFFRKSNPIDMPLKADSKKIPFRSLEKRDAASLQRTLLRDELESALSKIPLRSVHASFDRFFDTEANPINLSNEFLEKIIDYYQSDSSSLNAAITTALKTNPDSLALKKLKRLVLENLYEKQSSNHFLKDISKLEDLCLSEANDEFDLDLYLQKLERYVDVKLSFTTGFSKSKKAETIFYPMRQLSNFHYETIPFNEDISSSIVDAENQWQELPSKFGLPLPLPSSLWKELLIVSKVSENLKSQIREQSEEVLQVGFEWLKQISLQNKKMSEDTVIRFNEIKEKIDAVFPGWADQDEFKRVLLKIDKNNEEARITADFDLINYCRINTSLQMKQLDILIDTYLEIGISNWQHPFGKFNTDRFLEQYLFNPLYSRNIRDLIPMIEKKAYARISLELENISNDLSDEYSLNFKSLNEFYSKIEKIIKKLDSESITESERESIERELRSLIENDDLKELLLFLDQSQEIVQKYKQLEIPGFKWNAFLKDFYKGQTASRLLPILDPLLNFFNFSKNEAIFSPQNYFIAAIQSDSLMSHDINKTLSLLLRKTQKIKSALEEESKDASTSEPALLLTQIIGRDPKIFLDKKINLLLFSEETPKTEKTVLDIEQENKVSRNFMIPLILDEQGNGLLAWNTRGNPEIIAQDLCEWLESSLSQFKGNKCFSRQSLQEIFSILHQISQEDYADVYNKLITNTRFNDILSDIASIENKYSTRDTASITGVNIPNNVAPVIFIDALAVAKPPAAPSFNEKFVNLLKKIKITENKSTETLLTLNPKFKDISAFTSFLQKKYGSRSKQEARTAIIEKCKGSEVIDDADLNEILKNYGIEGPARDRLKTKALAESFRQELNNVPLPSNAPNLPLLINECNKYLEMFNDLNSQEAPTASDITKLEREQHELLELIKRTTIQELLDNIKTIYDKYDIDPKLKDEIFRKFYYRNSPVPAFLRSFLNLFTQLYLWAFKKEPSYTECLKFDDILRQINESTSSLIKTKYQQPSKANGTLFVQESDIHDLKSNLEILLQKANESEQLAVTISRTIGIEQIKKDTGAQMMRELEALSSKSNILDFLNKETKLASDILSKLKEDGYSEGVANYPSKFKKLSGAKKTSVAKRLKEDGYSEGVANYPSKFKKLSGAKKTSVAERLGDFFNIETTKLIQKIIDGEESPEKKKKELVKIYQAHLALCEKHKIPFKEPVFKKSERTPENYIFKAALSESYAKMKGPSKGVTDFSSVLIEHIDKQVEKFIEKIINNELTKFPYTLAADTSKIGTLIKMHSNHKELLEHLNRLISNKKDGYFAKDYPFFSEIYKALSSDSKTKFKEFLYTSVIMNEVSFISALRSESYIGNLRAYFEITHQSLNNTLVHRALYKELQEKLTTLLQASTYEERKSFAEAISSLDAKAVDHLANYGTMDSLEKSKKDLRKLILFIKELPEHAQSNLKRAMINQASSYTLPQKLYIKYSPDLMKKSKPRLNSKEKVFFITESLKEIVFTTPPIFDLTQIKSAHWDQVKNYAFEGLIYGASPSAASHWHRLHSQLVTNVAYLLVQSGDEAARRLLLTSLLDSLCPNSKQGYSDEQLTNARETFKQRVDDKISSLLDEKKGIFSKLSSLLFSSTTEETSRERARNTPHFD